jgi:hypothetical protein
MMTFYVTVTGVIGSLQAMEVIKVICGITCILKFAAFHDSYLNLLHILTL